MGRPNAGKSTLINKIIGEDRLLTGPEAGITRDAISLRIDWADPDGGSTPDAYFRYRGDAQKGQGAGEA